MKPRKDSRATTQHDENGRVCVRCKEYKIWKEYYKTIKLRIVCKTEVNQHSSSCKECHRKDMKELSAKNRRENPNIKPRYNIGLDKKEETVPFVMSIKHGKTSTRTVLIVPDIFLAAKTVRKTIC